MILPLPKRIQERPFDLRGEFVSAKLNDELSRNMLIAACAPDGTLARRAWDDLVSSTGSAVAMFNALHRHPASRLLPLVLQRHQLLGVDDARREFLAGAAAEAWGFNLRLFETIVPIIEQLIDADIGVTAIKGFALVGDGYATHDLRPMGDVDVMIRPDDFTRARRILEEAGWHLGTPRWPNEKIQNWAYLHGAHSYPFSQLGSFVIDIHWRAARELTSAQAEFWKSCVALGSTHPYSSTGISRPSNEWTVIVLAMHAAQARNRDLVHPLADLAQFLGLAEKAAPRDVDWGQVTAITNRERVTMRVRSVLEELCALLQIPEPFSADELRPSTPRAMRLETRAMIADVRQGVDASTSKLRRLLVQLLEGTRAESAGLGPIDTLKIFLARVLIARENIILARSALRR